MTVTHDTTTVSMFTKEIRYDRESKDFAMYLNGELIGYAPTYLKAEMQLNSLVHDILTRTAVADTADIPVEDALDVLNALAEVEAEAAEPTAQPISTDLIYHDFRHVGATIDDDGTLTLEPMKRDSTLITLNPMEAYDLYTFFTKFPHVAAMMERLEAQRQQDFAHIYHEQALRQAEAIAYKRGYQAAINEFAMATSQRSTAKSVV